MRTFLLFTVMTHNTKFASRRDVRQAFAAAADDAKQ